ncbi:MAG: helix-turn-helix domain-containing protein [Parasutterella sp.]
MQIQLMKQFCGCARYVYNRTLSLERSLYKKRQQALLQIR